MKDILLFSCLLVFFFAATSLNAQKVSSTTQTISQNIQIKCSDPEAAVSCNSFKELVASKDVGILEALHDDHVFVCFRPKNDVFLIFSYMNPSKVRPTSQSAELSIRLGIATLARYKNGVSDPGGETVYTSGSWSKSSAGWTDYTGHSLAKGDDGLITIDTDEGKVEHTFDSESDDKVSYAFTVRKSTGRYSESFTNDRKNHHVEFTGRCLVPRDVHPTP